MPSKIITEKINLDAEFFDKTYKAHLLRKFRESLTGRCDEKNGYITKVVGIVKIIDNFITSNGAHTFVVDLRITHILPRVGDVMTGTVCILLETGVIVEIDGLLKCMVPISTMPGYKLVGETYIGADGSTINKDDQFSVKISIIRYVKRAYTCIAKPAV